MTLHSVSTLALAATVLIAPLGGCSKSAEPSAAASDAPEAELAQEPPPVEAERRSASDSERLAAKTDALEAEAAKKAAEYAKIDAASTAKAAPKALKKPAPKARRRKYKGTSSPTPRLDRPVLAGAEQRSARLAQAIRAFDNALAPEHLSCAGAQPHRDAICSIAERLCELPDGERELTGAQEEDCEHARDACKTARARYRDRCGADD